MSRPSSYLWLTIMQPATLLRQHYTAWKFGSFSQASDRERVMAAGFGAHKAKAEAATKAAAASKKK